MASVFDVADYVLAKQGTMSAMKLQKLVYYSQAWHLVWADNPLFAEPIEAWANGPVAPHLYSKHRGAFKLDAGYFHGNPAALTADEAESVDKVLAVYGGKTSQWLSDLTHMEAPWQDARIGIADGDRCDNEISLASMSEYYGAL